MTRSHCTEAMGAELGRLGLPCAAFLARALVALLTCRKASVQQMSSVLPGPAGVEAKRQEFRRFLDQPALGAAAWAGALAALLPAGPAWVLALDRTEWKVGGRAVNLLVLAVVCCGCAVPLFWAVLGKPGASDTRERIALLEQFLAAFGRARIGFVTADREFIGRDWVAWLLRNRVPFRIRIKAGEYLEHEDGREKRASGWFGLRACPCKPRRMRLWGLPVFVGGKRLGHDRRQFLVVISSEEGSLLEQYRQRWKIETLFQAFKGRGFDLEASRVTEPVRLSRLFGLLSLALCWCLRVGEFAERPGPPPRPKKHGRRQESVFHRGMSILRPLLAPLAGEPDARRFVQAVKLLRPPKPGRT